MLQMFNILVKGQHNISRCLCLTFAASPVSIISIFLFISGANSCILQLYRLHVL